MTDSVVEELARKRLGRTIKGKWRLDRLIGVGGMAAVYAATHRNGAKVAIKMLHATISASQQIRARFIREGYLANKVDHPGVVRVLDDDIDDQDQSAFLVMDLVIGATLSDRAMERLLDDKEVLDVAEQVLSVLAAAHKQGIVHRDLKPDNLLVDKNGKVHVLDFGIARLLDDTTAGISATKTGTAFGTPGFMAPEQAMGKTNLISARTDIYSLGATLFALVSGDFVHAAENPQELMVLVATQPARSLRDVAPQMHPDVIALIDKSTRNEPENRWASADAMLTELRRVKAKIGSSPVMPITPYEPLANTPSSTQPIELSGDDLQSVRPPPATPHPVTPAPSEVAHTPSTPNVLSPFGAPSQVALSTVAPLPATRRPRVWPLAVIGGAAALIGIVAIVVVSRRPSATPASAEETAPAPPRATQTAANTEVPTTPTIDLAPSTSTTASAVESTTTEKPTNVPTMPNTKKIGGTTTATTTAASTKSTAKPGKKPIDVGY